MSAAPQHDLNLDIIAAPLVGSRLIEDYLAGAAALAPFFAGHPFDPSAYARKANEIDARVTPTQRASLRSVIRPTSEAARAKLERILAGEGLVVTTGQQPGLFDGPLYTTHKVLTAVRLAAELQSLLGREVTPLFWLASNDHDWQEANHTHVIDVHNYLRRIELPERTDAPVSMAHRMLGADVDAAFDQLTQLLPGSEFTPALLEQVRRAYAPERTMADAFAERIETCFAEFDLLMVDATDPALCALARPLFERELSRTSEHARVLQSQTERVEAAGYSAQVSIASDAANVFYEDDLGRERLVREAGSWQLRRTKRRMDDSEVRALLADHSERFSPNVLLRPVVESALFPTLAYVAGPAETSYFAQIGCLFAEHEVGMPLIFPRASITLVEHKVRKVLDKMDLQLKDFRRPLQQLTAQIVRDELPAEVSEALSALRAGLDNGYETLERAARAIDPTLKGPLGKAHNASQGQLRDAEKKILVHVKARNEVVLDQVHKAAVNLFPNGEPQERVLTLIHYLVRFGPELLPAIARAIHISLDLPAPAWRGVECP